MEPLLAYRKATLWLLAVYLPTLVIPWVLICVLDFHPLNAPSYDNQQGRIQYMGVLAIYAVLSLIRVLNTISAVLVVPVVGGILAHAAVVFSQRRKVGQRLNLLQLLTLADRGWGSILIMWSARSRGASSSFLWVAALMTVISTIQQPIQSGFVNYEPLIVMSCADLPQDGRCLRRFPTIAAYDAEPGLINYLPHNTITSHVAGEIVALSDLDEIANLWVDNPYANVQYNIDAFTTQPNRGFFFWFSRGSSHARDRYFASALPNGTTTGVLRQHAMRMNSSTHCEPIARDSFPFSSCSGAHPVQTTYSNRFINISVCAPGEAGVTPWKPIRDRQDISEELYIDVQISRELNTFAMRNFTTKCTTGSSMGYFELGNYKNDFAYGPLIDKWPSPEKLAADFNDYLTTSHYGVRPTVEDVAKDKDLLITRSMADPFGTRNFNISGPLMTAASALFGNYSFLNIADPVNNLTSNQLFALMCKNGGIPFALPIQLVNGQDFSSYCSDYQIGYITRSRVVADSTIASALGTWFFNRFNATENAEYILDMTMFMANRAALNKAVTLSQGFNQRPIYTSPGTVLYKPTKSLAGTIIVSLLIGMQLVGLGWLVVYIYSVPTWTRSLDALAVARIGGEVPEGELPPLGPVTKEDERRLKRVDGLIGVKDAGVLSEDLELTDVEGAGARAGRGSETSVALIGKETLGEAEVELVLGGRGVVTRRLL
ncbi:hypothetical protein R3P38DRAFT_2635099 [Favolaschia claudopus]|uniref:Uncharacterized protein n=1 Tax=Favolaschia claudopus TaxID=2862362 RepID=A0AAW0AW73_9AGAR